MKTFLSFGFVALLISGAAYGSDISAPVGTWKAIDDKTGKPRSVVRIYEQDGRLPIDACVSEGALRLRRPDVKDDKTKIVRVFRDVAHEPTQGGSDR